MTQNIYLVVPGAGDESIGHQVVIESDTTVADLLHAANLDPANYMLQKEQGDKRVTLSSEDRVAEHVQEGEKVFAYPKNMVVGWVF